MGPILRTKVEMGHRCKESTAGRTIANDLPRTGCDDSLLPALENVLLAYAATSLNRQMDLEITVVFRHGESPVSILESKLHPRFGTKRSATANP